MNAAFLIRGRRSPRRSPRAFPSQAFAISAAGAPLRLHFEYPGIPEVESDSRSTWLTGSFAALLHAGAIGFLALLASFAPEIQDELRIPVQLLPESEPPPAQPKSEPAPAPRALAERRLPSFAPQIRSAAPQVLSPSAIAAPDAPARALELEAVGAVQAPALLERSAVSVERVQPVESIASAQASAVDVSSAIAPAVRGPAVVDAPAGPSRGPSEVRASDSAPTLGSATFEIGGAGASVREGALGGRDAVGVPDGAPIAEVATAVGDAYRRGPGGGGSGASGAAEPGALQACRARPAVQNYLEGVVRKRTLAAWKLPVGIREGRVVLRFQIDVAGSPSRIQFVRADDNALGASAIDAMRAAAPFPPLPEAARCIADAPITGNFHIFADAGAG